jgi:hypothetical protein
MKAFLIICAFGIAFLYGFESKCFLRIHFRTGMKGPLLMGVGLLLGLIGVLGMVIRCTILAPLLMHKMFPFDDPVFLFFGVVFAVGTLIGEFGFIIFTTSESGFVVELHKKTTVKQWLTGNVPILKYEKPPPPAMSRRTGLIWGIIPIIFGLLLITLNIIFKHQPFYIDFFVTATIAFIIGLMLIIVSIIYLDKKSPERK